MKRSTTIAATVAVVAALFLAGCETAEERAQGHYQNALKLLEEGDVDRAIVEFRNVFRLNAQHTEARKVFAKTMMERGNIRQAYGSYLFVAENNPDDLEALKALARMASESQDWEEFTRHGTRAQDIAPDDPEVQVIWQALQYRKGILDEDEAARREAARVMATLLETRPDDMMAYKVVIDGLLRDQEYSQALDKIDAALAVEPDDQEFIRARLAVLSEIGRDDLIEAQLLDLVNRFPDDETHKATLIRWYMSRQQVDKAEEVLRDDAFAEEATTEDRANYLRFVQQLRGPDVARTEIGKFLDQGKDTEILRALRAGIDFEVGKRNEAVAELEDIVAGAQPSDQLRNIKIALARMLLATGDAVGARQRVEEVLSEDPTNVEGLKMRANWQIDQDLTDEAIVTLRTALDQAPQDPQIMTLMARSYLRSGNRDLAGDMLSLAVDASGKAPEESILYARFLIDDDKLAPAESILIDALRLAPGNIGLLSELGRVYIGQSDWPRLEQVEGTLRRLETNESRAAADSIRLARLQAQQKTDEALQFLESVVQNQGGNAAAELAIVQTHLRNGDLAAAESYVENALTEDPESRLMRFLKAGILAATDRSDEAEAIYRAMLAENDQEEILWRSLYTLLSNQGRFADARTLLGDAIKALPGSPNLQWALAGELEREGDIDGAIAIYESLYETSSNSPIVANNLASLISTYKDDAENLDRAWTIARRLRGADRPEFQDTFGWIALRRGELDEALAHLEPAARGLPNDPLVQYHLAVAYEKAGRTDEALAQFRRAVEIAGPADSRPQIKTAREEIARLETMIGEEPAE